MTTRILFVYAQDTRSQEQVRVCPSQKARHSPALLPDWELPGSHRRPALRYDVKNPDAHLLTFSGIAVQAPLCLWESSLMIVKTRCSTWPGGSPSFQMFNHRSEYFPSPEKTGSDILAGDVSNTF